MNLFREASYAHENDPAKELVQLQQAYHHAEMFDPKKNYETGVFVRDFGQGQHRYFWGVSIVDQSNALGVVFAQEELTPEEERRLAPFCDCAKHKASWLTRRFYCGCCVGCLESSTFGVPQFRIDRARAKYLESIGGHDGADGSLSPTSCIVC
jgi:hypothetical protein